MNLNLIAYCIYFFITAIIIIKIGSICYINGKTFIINLIPEDVEFCSRVNNLLLMGYYLLNIGYTILTLSKWDIINTSAELIEAISFNTAKIICMLAILHYFNLFWLTKFIKKIK